MHVYKNACLVVSFPHFQQHSLHPTSDNTMLCGGIRVTKKKTVMCRSPAKYQFDGFCCKDHRDEAKLYATKYDAHIETVKEVFDDPTLIAVYNSKIRPYFASSIIAGRENKEAQFLKVAEAKYAENAKVSWEVLRATTDSDDGKAVQNYKATVDLRKSIKRKQKDTVDVSQLIVLSDSPPLDDMHYVGHANMPVLKKVKVEGNVNAEPIVPDVGAGVGDVGDVGDVGESAGDVNEGEGGEALDESGDAHGDGCDEDYDAEADAALQKEIEDEIEANKVKFAAGVALPDDDMDFDE